MIYTVFRSVLVTSCIATVIAYFLTHFSVSFLKSFLLFFIIQIGVWQVYTHYLNIKTALRLRELNNELARDIATQSTPLACAYCKQVNIVNIRLDTSVKFECEACEKVNSVIINIHTAQITIPQ